MLAYNYDENKEFIGCETLQKNPLEKDKWLIPANSTLIAPPQYNPQKQKCVFDGMGWKVIEKPQEQTEEIPVRKEEDFSKNQRKKRDVLLFSTDKFMLEDYPITLAQKQDYIAYRKYLRDIPENPDFPNITIQTFEQWKGA